jgi:uncharacterized protein (TIGR00297 family)
VTFARSGRTNETLRQVVHIAFGLVAISLRWLPPAGCLLLLVAALAHNLFLIPRYARSLWRREDEARGFAEGVVLYPAVLLGAVVIFLDRLHLAAAVWGLLAFGDGAATLVGRAARGSGLPWNPRKTWAGTIAYALAGTLAAAALVAFVSLRPDQGNPIPFAAAFGPCAVVALAAAFVESLPAKLDDNLTTSAVAAACLAAWAAIVPAELARALPTMEARLPWAAGTAAALAAAAFAARTVDLSGAICGFVLAVVIAVTGGWGSLAVFGAFFVLASAATRVGAGAKRIAGIAEPQGARRRWNQAIANGGVAAGLSFLSMSTGRADLFRLAFAGAVATAAFDTVATEIGKAARARAVLLPAGREVPPGTRGAISREGTLAGAGAAALVALAGAALGLHGSRWIPVVVVAAGIGATLESIAGAWLDRRDRADHDALNVLSTGAGAAVCLWLGSLFGA